MNGKPPIGSQICAPTSAHSLTTTLFDPLSDQKEIANEHRASLRLVWLSQSSQSTAPLKFKGSIKSSDTTTLGATYGSTPLHSGWLVQLKG